MKLLKLLAATTAVAALLASPAFAQTRIALVVKSLGNGFFDAANKGAQEAAAELGDVEVIYTGLRQTPEMIVEAALQEDVDVVGLSILSGAHMALVPRVLELLRAEGLNDVLVLIGGIIPDDDVPALLEMGVSGVFGPGTNTQDIVQHITAKLGARR